MHNSGILCNYTLEEIEKYSITELIDKGQRFNIVSDEKDEEYDDGDGDI